MVTIDHEKNNPERSDNSLLDILPESMDVIRTRMKGQSIWSKMIDTGYLFWPDSILFRWKPYLLSVLEKAVNEFNPRFVLITVPPFSLLSFITKYFKNKNIPIIYDFRDPASFWVSSPFPSKFHYLYIKHVERKCLTTCALALVVSPEMKNIYSKLYPFASHKIEIVFNSFNDYKPEEHPVVREKFVIGYFGSFYFDPYSDNLKKQKWWKKKPYQYLQYIPYKQDWKYRTPYFFFKALSYLFHEYPEYKETVSVVFCGNELKWFTEMVREFDLESVVLHKGFLPKDKVVELENQCNAFLITSSKFLGARDYCIAGKTYDYFRYSKPIIAFVSDGDQKWAVENSGLGIICNPDDPIDSYKKLQNLFDDGSRQFYPNYSFLDQFTTNSQLSNLLLKIEHTLFSK